MTKKEIKQRRKNLFENFKKDKRLKLEIENLKQKSLLNDIDIDFDFDDTYHMDNNDELSYNNY